MSQNTPPIHPDTPEAPTPRKKQHKKSAIPLLIRWIVIALLALSVILLVWTNREHLTFSSLKNWVLGNNEGPGYPVTLTDGSVAFQNFLVENGEPAVVSSTTFLRLDDSGKELTLRQHGYTTPVMERWGSNYLIYDLGNKSFRVSTDGSTFEETPQFEHNIYCGAIAKNGSYAIASASDGYTSQLKVYDRDGLILFEWASQQYLISTVAFSPNSKYIVASGFASQGGSLKTVIHVFAFNKDQPLATHTLDDCVMLDIIFNTNDTVTAIGDTCAARFTIGKGLQLYDYQGLTLSAYDLTRSDGAVLALSASSDGRVGSLILLNDAFEATTITRFEQALDSVQRYGKHIVLLSDGLLSVLNKEGTTVFYADAGVDAIKAECNKDVCYILGTGEIRTVKLDL